MTKKERNIIIFNLKTDAQDAVLGFTTDWINAIAQEFSKVFVITMVKGKDETAKNVEVFSLGKEKGYSEIRRIFEFYKILFTILRENTISMMFAHMTPEFAILAGPVARAKKIPLILWFAHKSVTWRLRLAAYCATKIITPSLESCRLKDRKKIIITGHGINLEKFKKGSRTRSKMKVFLTVSRISRIKNIDKMIDLIARLYAQDTNIVFKIIGSPLNSADKKYLKYLKTVVKKHNLDRVCQFVSAKPYKVIHKEYMQADYFLNFSDTGSIDKTVLEALACGCVPITTNEAFKAYPFYVADISSLQLRYLPAYNTTQILKQHNLSTIVSFLRSIVQ